MASRVKGKRLYECDDCKNRQYLHPLELMRRTKPRCYECGCTRLVICSPEGKNERVELNDRLVNFDDSRRSIARQRHR